jgi:hypothetical protein
MVMALLLPTAQAASPHTVQILEVYPAGDTVTLAPQDRVFVRLHYNTPSQTRLFVVPYYNGRPVPAFSDLSPTYTGSGEAVLWFSLSPGDRIDQVRVFVGNSHRVLADTRAVSMLALEFSEEGSSAHRVPPSWVPALPPADHNASSRSGEALVTVLMLAAFSLATFALFAPLWGLLRWQGRWRQAMMVPFVVMWGFVLLLALQALVDASTLGLLPLVILLVAAPCALFVTVVMIAHAVVHRRQHTAAAS